MKFPTVRSGFSVSTLRADASSRQVKAHFRKGWKPRKGNVDGQFFVDESCIDCDACRWIAPKTFTSDEYGSIVFKQPETREERIEAIRATLSCPTCVPDNYNVPTPRRHQHRFSISMRHKSGDELKEARAGMPWPVPDCEGVYHCGFHSERAFGASSYLITRPEGNILVDAPRFSPVLAKKFEEFGGVKYIVLSHIDDIGDHDKWAKRFGSTRIMHSTEIKPSIDDIETQLQGEGPWNLSGETVDQDTLDGGIQLVHVPGHTAGSIVMWHEPAKAIFTGDHLGWSARAGRASLFEEYNCNGLGQQLDSVRKLLDYDFMHVLPGHGRKFRVKDAADRLKMVNDLAAVYAEWIEVERESLMECNYS